MKNRRNIESTFLFICSPIENSSRGLTTFSILIFRQTSAKLCYRINYNISMAYLFPQNIIKLSKPKNDQSIHKILDVLPEEGIVEINAPYAAAPRSQRGKAKDAFTVCNVLLFKKTKKSLSKNRKRFGICLKIIVLHVTLWQRGRRMASILASAFLTTPIYQHER